MICVRLTILSQFPDRMLSLTILVLVVELVWQDPGRNWVFLMIKVTNLLGNF